VAALLKFRGRVQQVDIASENLQTEYNDHISIVFYYSVPDLYYVARVLYVRRTSFAGETADLDIHPTTPKDHTDEDEDNRITCNSY
jgi:hypothetical protein